MSFISLAAWSRKQLEGQILPGKTAVIRITDPGMEPAKIFGEKEVIETLDLCFNDVSEGIVGCGLVPPTASNAQAIRDFANKHTALGTPFFIAQCEAGLGRSQAIVAGILTNLGENASPVLRNFTYNRSLFKMICDWKLVGFPEDPKVAVIVRKKYPSDRLHAFLLSLQRQRYDNWKCLVVTDGPNQSVPVLIDSIGDDRIYFMQTAEMKYKWGHPYRAMSIKYALDMYEPAYITLQNDDNYLTPGFLEQMVASLEGGKDLSLCDYVNCYQAYNTVTAVVPYPGGCDLCQFLASASLMREVQWEGEDFEADGRFMQRLAAKAGKVTVVRKPLVVKN